MIFPEREGLSISLETKPLSEIQERLINSDGDSLIYASGKYQQFVTSACDGEIENLLAYRDGELVGALCAVSKTVNGTGKVINSLPWYGSHGGCIVDENDDQARSALLGAFRELAGDENVISATVIATPNESQNALTYRKVLQPRVEDSRIGQITDLPTFGPNIDDDLQFTCKQKTRNLVRKSLRQGFNQVADDSIDAWRELHHIHQKNMKDLGGKAKPWRHFELLRKYIPAEKRRLTLAMLGDKIVAALLLLNYEKTVEYFVPVVKVDYRTQQPLSFLIFNGMRWAAEQGYRRWNWGGTWAGQRSLHHFKSGWGAKEHSYNYFTLCSSSKFEEIRKKREYIFEAFPYFFVYPYDSI